MPPAVTGSGKDSTTFMDDLAKRLDRLEEVLRGLVGKVDDIDQQQQGLSVAVLRLKKLVSDTGANNLMDSLPEITLPGAASGVPGDSLSAAPRSTNGHPGLPPHRHQTVEIEPDDGNFLFLPTYHKLDFPKYYGTVDPLPWLNRCEHYFHVRQTPDHKRVSYALFHLLDDAQLWFHRMELNGPWLEFTRLINTWFGPPMTDTPLGELALLRRTGSLDEICSKFMSLSCRDHTLMERRPFAAGH
jgi:hypothetical protein